MNERIVLFENKEDCCGCGACAYLCPVSAITLEEDECGYIYPYIDDNKCINCGKCLRSCVYKNGSGCKNEPIEGYAATNTDEIMANNSASGGVFSAVASSFIEKGGYIAGAVEKLVNDKFVFEHIVGNDENTLKCIQGSKYVQSNAYVVFDEVNHLLKEDKNVLFSGTPCQVDAIRKITGDPDNLLTMDLICHGAPSQKLFCECIELLEFDLNSKIRKFIFRTKNKDLKGYYATVVSDKNSYFIPHWLISYYYFFLKGSIFRKNCYSCPYACGERVSDVTIGDFWGIEERHALDVQDGKIDLTKCWSGVLVNTNKGQNLINENNKLLKIIPSSYVNMAANNKQLNYPSMEPNNREQIISAYMEKGYTAVEKMFRKELGGKIKFWIKRKLFVKKNKSKRQTSLLG